MRITWDESKAAANQAKHGVSFAEAARVFALPEHIRLTMYDLEHSDDEDRWTTMGLLAQGVLIVVYVIRGPADDEYRIISARLADGEERRAYADHLAGNLP
jgi:uncharacterized DUF497 family protein